MPVNRLLLICGLAFYCIPLKGQVAVEWQQCSGAITTDEILSMIQSADGGFAGVGGSIVSGNNTNFSIIKTDSLGNQQWMHYYGGTLIDRAYDIMELPGGGYLLAGESNSSDGDVTGAHGDYDGWVVKTDDSGNIIWQKAIGGSDSDRLLSCLLLPNGNYLLAGITGSYDGDLQGVGNSWNGLWMVELDTSGVIQDQAFHIAAAWVGYNLVATSDGGFATTGWSGNPGGIIQTNYGTNDLLAVKLDSSYNVVWAKVYGGTQGERGQSIMETSDGKFIVVGYTGSFDLFVSGNHGWYDYWVVKLDSAGGFVWQKCLGSTGYERELFGVLENAEGSYVVAGSSFGSTAGGDISHPLDGNDFWVAGLDTSGNLLWERTFGGGMQEYDGSLIKTSDGAMVLAGSTYSNDYDVSGRIGNANQTDGWIVKFRERPNIIKGTCYVDANNNLVQDPSEYLMTLLDVKEQTSGQHVLTNSLGVYEIFLPYPGSYLVSADTFPYFNCIPVNHTVVFNATNQVDSLNDFAFQPIPGFVDLEITATLNGFVRPGFVSNVQLVYRNAATTTMSGEVTLAHPAFFTYDASVPVATQVLPDTIKWSFSGLPSYQSDTISIDLATSQFTSIGTPFVLTATVHPVPGDLTPVNNTDTISTVVVGSVDPNDIAVDITSLMPGQVLNPPYLEYLIRFQNVGTFPATFIEVINPIDPKLDMSTFDLIATSHTASVNYLAHSRNMDFFFDNINLPDSVSDEPGSHGFIRYRVKPYPTLAIGDSIFNAANIYFDYNYPVATNVVATVVENPLSLAPGPQPGLGVSAYPNPFREELNVECNTVPGQPYAITVTDVLGKVRYAGTHIASGVRMHESVSSARLPAGVYFLEVSGSGVRVNRKIVRQ